jgi:peptide/nickel transport system permease protein
MVDPGSSRYLPPGSRLLEIRLTTGERALAEMTEIQGEELLLMQPNGRKRTFPLEQIANLEGGAIQDRRFFLLGTDRLGRDVWSRILVGARVSLGIGLAAMFLAILLGTALGSVAALAGPRLDNFLMRLVDAFLAFPSLFLIIGLAAIFQPSTQLVVLILGFLGWMPICRLTRAELQSLQQREFVLASRGLGQGPLAILWRHLLPNALTPLIVEATLLVGELILAEAALSYFGLGVQPPTPSWGNMISDGKDNLGAAWWVAAFPGLAIVLTVIGCNLLGDALRERLDPRHQR